MSLETENSKEQLESAASDEVAIAMSKVNKWFGDFHVLKDIDLSVFKGERIVICGPSGSGKSTLIRCINRLEEHQNGDIVVNGTTLDSNLKNIHAIRSDVGMVFQSFNLFPHLTVLENCTLAPIWVKNFTKSEAETAAMEYLERVKIPEQAAKYPGQLSGGQQQRVALARLLQTGADIMLLDEPFGALDEFTRERLNVELLRIVDDPNITTVFVTHNITEAIFLGDQVFVMTPRPGRIAAQIEIDLPKPRSIDMETTPEFQKYVQEVRDVLASHLEEQPL